MNRKDRRVAQKQDRPPDPEGAFAQALSLQQQGRLEEAARAYKRLISANPRSAKTINNLGIVLQMQGRLAEASACFAQALSLRPQLFDQFAGIVATLAQISPSLAEALSRTNAAWPNRLSLSELFGTDGLAAIAQDPLLLYTLGAAPVRDVALERLLTSLRAELLKAPEHGDLALRCALARQCFINEYVWATSPDEDSRIEELKAGLDPLTASPGQLAMLGAYVPLHSLLLASQLAERKWPAPFDDVMTQQVREPAQERTLRASIPKLTAIDDATSLKVQAQYEDNPYPRRTVATEALTPVPLDQHLRGLFPTSAFVPLGDGAPLNVLVAGCGAGWNAVFIAGNFANAHVLAVDLSLTSLAYAIRSTPPALRDKIDYAQADILKLGGCDRHFDMIDATGVLHHMADPLEGWRILLGLLRPGGVMHLAFYSELGRRDIVDARNIIQSKGYGASAAEIRTARQELLAMPDCTLPRFKDFFSTSECRDLLMHAVEHRMTIPMLKEFIEAAGLKFIGFEFNEPARQKFQGLFAQYGRPLNDLDRWHEVEQKYPDTFAGMYQFWVQKP